MNIFSEDWSSPIPYYNKGHEYRDTGDFDKSIKAFQQSLNYSKEESQRYIKEASLLNIGAVYNGNLGDAKKAEEYYKKAIELIGLKHTHNSKSFKSVNLKPFLYKSSKSFGRNSFIPSYINNRYSSHYIYQHIPKMGGRAVIDPVDIALRVSRSNAHYTNKEEGELRYLYWWRRIQGNPPIQAI